MENMGLIRSVDTTRQRKEETHEQPEVAEQNITTEGHENHGFSVQGLWPGAASEHQALQERLPLRRLWAAGPFCQPEQGGTFVAGYRGAGGFESCCGTGRRRSS